MGGRRGRRGGREEVGEGGGRRGRRGGREVKETKSMVLRLWYASGSSHLVRSNVPKLSEIILQVSLLPTPSTPITKANRLAALGSISKPRVRENTLVLSSCCRTKQAPRSWENLQRGEGPTEHGYTLVGKF